MKKNFWNIVCMLMVTSLLFAACSTPATPAPAAEAPSAPAQPAGQAIDCSGVTQGDKLTVMYQWSGSEEEKANTILKPFVDACGVQIVSTSNRDAAVLDTMVKSTPPDVLFWPSTSPLTLYPDQLKDLSTMGAMKDNYADYWVKMGSMDGKLLALPVKADIKSIIWYSPAAFDKAGYKVPATLDDLDTLVEKMVADGMTPWSMGFESEAATGWSGSDFVQDLLLAQKGPDYVNDIISGKVAYNDAGVLDAYTLYSKWASGDKYTVGGGKGTVSTPFLDAIYKVFQPKSQAMMVKQSGFAGGEITKKFPNLKYGTDFDFFPFPGAQGMQGGADFVMAFNDSPAAKALMAYLTSDVGAENWAKAGFDISPNKLAADKYTDVQLTKKAAALATAKGFTPDLGDTIPAPFGTEEWKAVIVAAQAGDIKAALDKVADAQAEALNIK